MLVFCVHPIPLGFIHMVMVTGQGGELGMETTPTYSFAKHTVIPFQFTCDAC